MNIDGKLFLCAAENALLNSRTEAVENESECMGRDISGHLEIS